MVQFSNYIPIYCYKAVTPQGSYHTYILVFLSENFTISTGLYFLLLNNVLIYLLLGLDYVQCLQYKCL